MSFGSRDFLITEYYSLEKNECFIVLQCEIWKSPDPTGRSFPYLNSIILGLYYFISSLQYKILYLFKLPNSNLKSLSSNFKSQTTNYQCSLRNPVFSELQTTNYKLPTTNYFHPPPRLLYKEITACNCCNLSFTLFNSAASRLCSDVSTSV